MFTKPRFWRGFVAFGTMIGFTLEFVRTQLDYEVDPDDALERLGTATDRRSPAGAPTTRTRRALPLTRNAASDPRCIADLCGAAGRTARHQRRHALRAVEVEQVRVGVDAGEDLVEGRGLVGAVVQDAHGVVVCLS